MLYKACESEIIKMGIPGQSQHIAVSNRGHPLFFSKAEITSPTQSGKDNPSYPIFPSEFVSFKLFLNLLVRLSFIFFYFPS